MNVVLRLYFLGARRTARAGLPSPAGWKSRCQLGELTCSLRGSACTGTTDNELLSPGAGKLAKWCNYDGCLHCDIKNTVISARS